MKKIIIAGFALMTLSGCSTIINGTTQDELAIDTKPDGLLVRVGTQQCKTPCTLKNVPRKTEYAYIDYQGKQLQYEIDKEFHFASSIVGNIWNEIWIGAIVDQISGGNKTIKPICLNFEDGTMPERVEKAEE